MLEIEASEGLFELKVNDIYLWQYVRYTCLTKILEENTGIETTNRIGGMEPTDIAKAHSIKEWMKYRQFLVHKKDIIVINHPRRVRDNGYYKCIVTDRILQNIKYSYYVFEGKYKGKHYKPVLTKHLKYIDTDIIKKFFKCNYQSYEKPLSEFTRKVIKTFEMNCNMKMSRQLRNYIVSYIATVYREIYINKIWIKIILTLIKPKAILVTVGYSPFVQCVVAEAKSRGITTIELQHGRIGSTHIAYNYIYNGTIETFADYMFVYGDYEKEIPRFPIKNERVISVGYPELERRAAYYANIKKNYKRKVIVFISGPSDGDVVSQYALQMRNNPKLKQMRMIYKLHPSEYGQWQEWYPHLANSGLEIVADNLHDIYYYIGHSDYVVGISSTVLFEATEFNTEICIIKERDYRKAEILYKNNMAYLVESVEQLVDGVICNSMKDILEKTRKYFAKNSIKNIQKQLEEIL